MKYIFTLLFACTLLSAKSQRFTAGLLSGTGYSDIHGNSSYGKWESKAGPLSGVFFLYALTPVMSIGTELNYASQDYYYKPYQNNNNYYDCYPLWSSFHSSSLIYLPSRRRWEFGFYRIPLYLTLSTPTKLKLSVSAGFYLSFTGDHEYTVQTQLPYYYDRNYYYPYVADDEPPRHDNGLMYGVALSYPLTDNFRVYAMGRYFTGHKTFIEGTARTGASELAFGLAYTGLFRSKKDAEPDVHKKDTLFSRLMISPRMGIGISGFRKSAYPDKYTTKSSLSPAIWLEYKLDATVSLLSGLSFERKGYHMSDSSAIYYRFARGSWPGYITDTRVDLDYAVIPMLLKIAVGNRTRVYVTGGTYLGLKLNARVTGTAIYESLSSTGYNRTRVDVYDDIEGVIKNTDWGWICGAGVELPLARGNKLELGLHYASGKGNILNDDTLYGNEFPESDDVIRNGTLNIFVALTLPIHKSNKI